MLLELWLSSSVYTGYGIAKYFIDKHMLTLSGPADDTADIQPRKPTPQKIIDIYTKSKEWDAPVYFSLGFVSFPVGGGFENRERHQATLLDSEQTSYKFVGMEKELAKTFWLNDEAALKEYVERNSIPKSAFPHILPICVREIPVTSDRTLWLSREIGLMGLSRPRVVEELAFKRTIGRPLWASAAFLAVITTIMVSNDYDSPRQQIKKRFGV
jgi:hypothetical protein